MAKRGEKDTDLEITGLETWVEAQIYVSGSNVTDPQTRVEKSRITHEIQLQITIMGLQLL